VPSARAAFGGRWFASVQRPLLSPGYSLRPDTGQAERERPTVLESSLSLSGITLLTPQRSDACSRDYLEQPAGS
jgi:hypothetical protein